MEKIKNQKSNPTAKAGILELVSSKSVLEHNLQLLCGCQVDFAHEFGATGRTDRLIHDAAWHFTGAR